MKTLIQKIIVNYFGTFINGIQKDKLSVDLLGGNFKLQNISLNQDYFNNLNTPFKLSYSSIGKLNLQAPLSKLSSTPVECILDNIYAVFQFKNQTNQKNEVSVEEQFISKKESLEKYIQEMFENYLKKLREREDKKEEGMMSKMGKKIIDNLQLRIVNVHIRFQQKSQISKYGWGLTLEEISFVTTDREWKPAFIDRSEANKQEKLLKKMSLKDLSIYWQSGTKTSENIFVNSLGTSIQKHKKMAQMIKDKRYSIISLTSQFKLIINPHQDFKAPLYQLSIDLAPIKFDLERIQVSQMIDFIKKNIAQNQEILKNLSLKKKKSSKQTNFEDRQKFQQNFFIYVERLLEGRADNKNVIYEDQEADETLKVLFSKIQYEQILVLTLKPIRNQVKIAREKQLKKKKKGWFGGEYQLTQEEIKALSDFVEESQQVQQTERPKSCLFFRIPLVINGGRFSFIQHKDKEQQQKFVFNIGRIETLLEKSHNQSLFNLNLKIKSIGLDFQLPEYNSSKKTKMNILSNELPVATKIDDFVTLSYMKQVQAEPEPLVQTNINGQVQRVIITYKKIYMKKFKSFFTFKNLNDDVRNETYKKWGNRKQEESITQSRQVQQKEVIKKFNINFKMISPLFICPLGKAEDAWCLNLGELSILSQRNVERQRFPMKVTSAYFRYYKNMDNIFGKQTHGKSEETFSVVNNINFGIVHTNYFDSKSSLTEVDLPNFQVNFTESQYHNLLTLTEIFKIDDEDFLEVLKKQRKLVEENKKYCGPLKKKNDNLDTWHKYHGVLSGEFIYLYGSEKELKCLQKISIKQIRLEFDEENQSLCLFQQHGIIELAGTQHENNTLPWKMEIQNQMKKFMSIYQIVEDLQQHEQTSKYSIRKRKQTNVSTSSTQKQLQININRISFIYQDNFNKELINFHIINLIFQEKKSNKDSAERLIKIDEFFTTDYIHQYKTKEFQSLIKAKNLSIEFRRLKRGEQKKIEVDVFIPQIQINWKPDVLIILLQLAYKHFSKEKKLRVDDGTEKTRQQLFQEVLSDKKFQFMRKQYEHSSRNRKVKEKRYQYAQKNKMTKQLVKFNCKINKMQIVMIHRQSHLPMFKLITDSIDNQFVFGEDVKFVAGSVNSIRLSDLTGYPQKTYEEDSYVKEFEILKPKMKIGDEQIINYKWSSYQAFKIPNQERVNSFMYITVNPIIFEYYQQITFRLIDYALIQIILLLNEPEMLVANENLLEQLKKTKKNVSAEDEHSPIVKILFSEYEEVIRKIINPYFMDMYFQLKNPSVNIRPEKQSEIYHRADFNKIVFHNQNIKDSRRFVNSECSDARKYIYQQEYLINCDSCDFSTVRQKLGDYSQQRLFEDVNIQLIVNKLIQQDEINVIYPEINTYDRSFYTHSKIQELKIPKCTKQQYLFLNKLINFNVIFDDNKDECFIHNFKITKLLSPKPIYFELRIPRIFLGGKQGREDNFYDLFDVEMQDFVLLFQRNKDLNSSYNIKLKKTSIYVYEYELEPSSKIQSPSKAKQSQKRRQEKPKRWQLIQIIGQNNEQCLQTIIRMKNSGQKIIEMNLLDMEIYLKIHLLQLIFQWSLLEDWVFPTVSIYANDITFHITIHKMSAMLLDTHKSKKDTMTKQFFQLLGVFCYKFHRKANYSQQHIEDKYRQKQMTTNQINDMPQTSYMSIIMNTQIFHCKFENSINRKRKVAEKMTFNMIEKRFYKVANEELFTIKTMANRQMNIDRSLLKISFTDVVLMELILKDIGEKSQYIKNLRKEIKKGQNENSKIKIQSEKQEESMIYERVPELNNETQISSLQNLQIEIQGLSIYLINNAKSSFIPVLRINFNSASLNKCLTSKKDILKGSFITTIYYFNGSIFRWEPMLQKCEIYFQKLAYKHTDTSETIYSSLQSQDPITFNISKEYILALKDILDEWNKKKRKDKKQPFSGVVLPTDSKLIQLDNKQQEFESIELVSQYIIRNQTGYPLEIYSHDPPKFIERINHGQQIDYEYELEKYESEDSSDINIMIGISICHPKYKFKRITHIPLDFNKQFNVHPVFEGSTLQVTKKNLPYNSYIRLLSEIKDLKRYCIIKSSKEIEDYTENIIKRTTLKFDCEQVIKLEQKAHKNMQVHLFKKTEKEKYRYIGENGILKILPTYLVYNYTPIPLNVNNNHLLPGQFICAFKSPVIQGIRYEDCKIIKIDKRQRTREFYLYCEAYIIDYAGLTYEFENSYDAKVFSHDFMENGQKFTVYLLPSSQYKYKVRLHKNLKSRDHIQCSATLKTAVGNQPFFLENYSSALCEYQSYGYLSQFTGNQYTDFKKIIEVTPQYVLCNATAMQIKVCQSQTQDSITLQKNDRVPFYWVNKNKPFQIKIAAFSSEDMWGYSGPVQIKQSTHSFVLRKSTNLMQYKIFGITLENTNTITFVHVHQLDPDTGNVLMLQNEVLGLCLKFYQSAVFQKDHEIMNPDQYLFTVNPGDNIPFSYELPLQKHQLVMQCSFDKDFKQYKDAYIKPLILQDIENNLFEKHLSVYRNGGRIRKLRMTLGFQRNVKKLKISEHYEQKVEENLGELLWKLPRVSINLIGYQKEVRKEIAALYMDGIQFEKATTNLTTTYTLVMGGLKIDNSLRIDPIYPILFTSTIAKENNHFLNFVVIKDNFNSNLIHYLGISMNKFLISITSEEIQCLQENISELQSSWSQGKMRSLKFRQYQLFKDQKDQQFEQLYFIEANINPLRANITFKHVNDWGGRIFKALASIDDCNIAVNGKKITHFTSKNISDFLKHVMKHYQEGMKTQFLPMLGNLSIIGSPISLVTRIGTGVKDFIELPSEGFDRGLFQGGKGLAKGTGSLFKNTFQGTFNSFESITGSVGNGVSSLIYDEDYNKSRNKIKNQRTQHVGDGLKSGGKSLINGIGRGLTGVITEPIKGAQQSGIGGFFKGGLKGITGLITKPVTGIIDATTKTFQGIKNTPSYFQKKQNGMTGGRVRNPRVFYGYCREIRLFDEDLSVCSRMLSYEDNDKFGDLSWYGIYHLISKQKEEKKPLLLLTFEYLIIYEIRKGKVIQAYSCNCIEKAEATEKNHVMLHIYDRKTKCIGKIPLKLKQAIEKRLVHEINTICRLYRPIYGYDYKLHYQKFNPKVNH